MQRRSQFDSRLATAATAVFLFDNQRRLRGFNAGCTALTGWDADDVLGQHGVYSSESAPDTAVGIVCSLCPPPDVFAGQQSSSQTTLFRKSGEQRAAIISWFPLLDGEGNISSVLGIAAPTDTVAPPTAVIERPETWHEALAAARFRHSQRLGGESFVAAGPVGERLKSQIALAQQTGCHALLLGPAGSGKEHAAYNIHFGGVNRSQWFIPLDCQRSPRDELERIWNRLLEVHARHERYRSVGPMRDEMSRGRTEITSLDGPPAAVYLAHIEHLPRDIQQQIVAAFPAGRREQWPNIRLIGGSRRSLAELEDGKTGLRIDLISMLESLVIRLPALTDRLDELPFLAQHFVEHENREHPDSVQKSGFDPAIVPAFLQYPWPGNLDELQAVIAAACAHAKGSLILTDDLPFPFQAGLSASRSPGIKTGETTQTLQELLDATERNLLIATLERYRFNKTRAAESLGINRPKLYRRMLQLGIEDREPSPTEEGRIAPETNTESDHEID